MAVCLHQYKYEGEQISSVYGRQEPPHHRKLMLKVANSLSKEDVADIVYLSEDFVPVDEVTKISSGIDLMRCLERHGRLRPGGYHYLLSCLREVGRIDVANTLSESLQTPLLNLPPSFSVSSQMYQQRIGILKRKQAKYSQYMKHMSNLSRDRHYWEMEWREIFNSLCQDFVRGGGGNLPGHSDVEKAFAATLKDITACSVSLVNALTNLGNVQDMTKTAELFGDTFQRFEKISTKLDGIYRQKDHSLRYMGHLHLASEACSFLGEFLAELLGQETISTQAQALAEGLDTMSTIVDVSQHGISLLQWFFTATDVVVFSSLDLQKYKSELLHTLSCLVQENVHTQNYDLYSQILQGTHISDRDAEETDGACRKPLPCSTSLSQSSNMDSQESIIPFCPILVTLCLNAYVLIHTNELGPGDWGRIKANYRLAEAKFAQMYSVVAEGVFNILCYLVDSFKHSIISAALEQAAGLQELVVEVLQYS